MIRELGSLASTQDVRGAAVPKAPGGKLGKEEFLKLLVAQMSNQDPMNPLQGEELAAQLAQFSSVEQLIGMNEKMGQQMEAQQALANAVNGTAALGVFGRTVTALGDQVQVGPGQPGRVSFESPVAGEGMLRIFDANGRVVGSRPLGRLSTGSQDAELGDAARGLPAGTYTFAVDVVDAAGKSVSAQTLVTARVDGIRFGSTGPVLTAGGITIPFGSIVRIVADS